MKTFLTLALLVLAGCATQSEQQAINAAAQDEARAVSSATARCEGGEAEACNLLIGYRQIKAQQAAYAMQVRRARVREALVATGDSMVAAGQGPGFTCNTFGTMTTCR